MTPRGDVSHSHDDEPELKAVTPVYPQRIGASPLGVVASAHYRASEAGARVLSEGGNAVDAAAATAFALGVCEPAASGLGGQTMMLVYSADSRKTVALDGSSRAPHRIEPGTIGKTERLRGHRAATVPATPAVLDYAVRTLGRLPIKECLAPAIELADNGYRVSALQARLTKRELKHLRAGTAAPFFLRDGTKPYAVGAVHKQPVLAETLRQLARRGIESLYRGKMAKALHDDMVKNDGLIRKDDLAQIPWPVERKPISGSFRSSRVLTMPPPGAGRTLIELLNILAKLPTKRFDIDSPRGVLMLAEAIRRAFIDRRDRPFDPNYYPQAEDKEALTEEYASKVVRQIRRRYEPQGETTHLSVMDRWGNVVALTQSIERVYGSFCASPELGFLYNNYMSAFEYDDISHPYYLRPNAVPWASVAPSIIFHGRKPWLAIGSPGSARITSSIAQVLFRLQHQSPLDAVTAPRIHCSINGRVSLEATRMRSDIPDMLRRYGFEVDVRDPFSFYLGCVQLVAREQGEFVGVADPRRDGSAEVPSQ